MFLWLLLLLPQQQEPVDFREAARLYHEAAQRDPSEQNLLILSRHLVAYNGAADAVKVLTWGLERHPNSAPLRVVLAAAFHSLSDYDRAAETICAAVDADPADLRTLQFLADFRAISEKHSTAIHARLQAYAQRYPSNAFARYHYALNLEGYKQEKELREARRLDPALPGPALELGILLESRGDRKKATTLLEEAVRLQPESQRAHYRLARLYQQTGQPAKAKRHMEIVRRLTAGTGSK